MAPLCFQLAVPSPLLGIAVSYVLGFTGGRTYVHAGIPRRAVSEEEDLATQKLTFPEMFT